MEKAKRVLARYHVANDRLNALHARLKAEGLTWPEIRDRDDWNAALRQRNRWHKWLNSPVQEAA